MNCEQKVDLSEDVFRQIVVDCNFEWNDQLSGLFLM